MRIVVLASLVLALAAGVVLLMYRSAEGPQPTLSAQAGAPPPQGGTPPEPEAIPLERLLRSPAKAEGKETDLRAPRRSPTPGGAPESSQKNGRAEVRVGSEREESVQPSIGVERKAIGVSVPTDRKKPNGHAVSVEGVVQEERYDDDPGQDRTNQAVGVRVNVPFGGDKKTKKKER